MEDIFIVYKGGGDFNLAFERGLSQVVSLYSVVNFLDLSLLVAQLLFMVFQRQRRCVQVNSVESYRLIISRH